MLNPNHPQVSLLLAAIEGVARETEKIPAEELPMAQPSSLTFAAVWQGFQLACDLFILDPLLMREIYNREGWKQGSAGLAPILVEELTKQRGSDARPKI